MFLVFLPCGMDNLPVPSPSPARHLSPQSKCFTRSYPHTPFNLGFLEKLYGRIVSLTTAS